MTKGQRVVRRVALLGVASVIAALAGCSSLGYYWQGLTGQVQILHAARPVPEWLEQKNLAPALRQRLESAQAMREFASAELGLPRNASYTRYANLERSHAVWNVVAAPPASLQLHRWCFPIAGCVGYRGYFSRDAALAESEQLQQQGLEVNVYGVPAYSTLGYLNWLGGDPLLSTFIDWQEGDFAGLLFHELAHQVVYLPGDTAFNESFASSVEQLATPLWLQGHASAASQSRWEKSQQRRQQWRSASAQTRQQLQQLYASNNESKQPLEPMNKVQAAIKLDIFKRFQSSYAELRAQWLAQDWPLLTTPELQQKYLQRLAQTDDWVAKANNASFGALAAYDDWVPAFTTLWQQSQRAAAGGATGEGSSGDVNGDTSRDTSTAARGSLQGWQLFYEKVREWAQLPDAERLQTLCSHMPAKAPAPAACLGKP